MYLRNDPVKSAHAYLNLQEFYLFSIVSFNFGTMYSITSMWLFNLSKINLELAIIQTFTVSKMS